VSDYRLHAELKLFLKIFKNNFNIILFMQKQFNTKSEKKRYEAPALESTFVEVEAGFAYSGDRSAGTTDFGVDESQNDESAWN